MQQAVKLLGTLMKPFRWSMWQGQTGRDQPLRLWANYSSSMVWKWGTFTSPHIVSMHDRICINGQPISDQDLIRLGQRIQAMESQLRDSRPTLLLWDCHPLSLFVFSMSKSRPGLDWGWDRRPPRYNQCHHRRSSSDHLSRSGSPGDLGRKPRGHC